jgi:hypothetical protein
MPYQEEVAISQVLVCVRWYDTVLPTQQCIHAEATEGAGIVAWYIQYHLHNVVRVSQTVARVTPLVRQPLFIGTRAY